jgi:AcrR family transcriptional regulator
MRSQDETRDQLRAAALELLLTTSPESLTVRAIAEKAASHHPFVASLFGGKVGLFRDIYPAVLAEAVAGLHIPMTTASLRPEMLRLARLAAWLATHDPDSGVFSEQRLAHVVATNFRARFDLEERHANLLAELMVAAALSWVLFPEVVSDHRASLLADHAAFLDKIAEALATTQG